MGKGDKRTKKGKRIMGTYGNSRKKKVAAPVIITKKKVKAKAKPAKEETVKETSAKKPAAKKAATKKPAAKKTTTKKPAASKASEAKEK